MGQNAEKHSEIKYCVPGPTPSYLPSQECILQAWGRRQKSKKMCLASWVGHWDFSKTHRERIMSSCYSLKTGPWAALYVMKLAESAGMRDHATMNEESP